MNVQGNENCNYWAKVGHCNTTYDWMKINCKSACNFCDESTTEIDDKTTSEGIGFHT